MTFEQATNERDRLETACSEAGAVLDQFPRGPMGLTPDAIKATDAYRSAKLAAYTAFQNLRNFNEFYLKTFKAEIKAARKSRNEALANRT